MSKRALFAVVAAAAVVSVAGAGAGGPAQKPSTFDRHFLMAAAENDRFEIATATLARRRGQTEAVCDFAARLLTDHRRSSSQLASLARTVRVTLPRKANPFQQWALGQLLNMPLTVTTGTTAGQTFAEGFTRLQAAAHRQAIRTFAEAARLAEHPRVRSFAQANLPTLRAHLKAVEEIDDEEEPATAAARCED